MTKLAKSFCFDLADTFARHRKMLADFLERVLGSSRTKPESHLDNFFLSRRQRREYFVGNLAQV